MDARLSLSSILVTLLLAGCAGGSVPTHTGLAPPEVSAAAPAAPGLRVAPTASAPTTVRVGLVPGVPMAGIYLGIAHGYFAEQGLELALEPFTAGDQMIPPLATGQIDAAGLGMSAAMYAAVARGAELQVVAGISSNQPGFSSSALVVRKELIDAGTIRELADLRGRTLGVIAPTSGLAIDASRGLQSAGLTDADVTWTYLSFPDQLPALANGAIDVGTPTEPFVARAVQTGIGVRWRGMDEIYPNHQLTTVAYSPSFAREQPEAAQRFLIAYLRGARDFVDAVKQGRDRAGVFQVLAEYTPIKDLSVYEQIVPSGIDPDGALNQESMEYDQDWYLARDYLHEKIELGRLVDLQYREAALQQLGPYTPRP